MEIENTNNMILLVDAKILELIKRKYIKRNICINSCCHQIMGLCLIFLLFPTLFSFSTMNVYCFYNKKNNSLYLKCSCD